MSRINAIEELEWSDWRLFPDPRKKGFLLAPYGYGLYQIKNIKTNEFILFGVGKNCAYRMSSLLPRPYGQGTRNNIPKRQYILENIECMHYRTIAFDKAKEMSEVERTIKELRIHKFNT